MRVEDNRIVIEALEKSARLHLRLPFSEPDLLVGMNPERAHADEPLESLADEELGDW